MVSSLVDPTTGEVDWEELLWLARCAMLNVKPEEDIRDAFDDNTGRSIEVPDVHQRVVYGRARGVQVVSFRGTKCRRSFAINLDTRLERLESLTAAAPEERSGSAETRMGGEEFRARPGRPIHRGYARASRACGEAVRPLIVPDVPLVLTGHSLGGALATVLGMSLADEGVDVKHIVTWGAPKVGPQGCGSELDILRVSHADDLVVYLPPRKLTGYSHQGHGLVLASAAEPHFALLAPDEKPCAVEALKKLLSVGADSDRNRRISCHRMARYLASVERYADAARARRPDGQGPIRTGEKELYRMESAMRKLMKEEKRQQEEDQRRREEEQEMGNPQHNGRAQRWTIKRPGRALLYRAVSKHLKRSRLNQRAARQPVPRNTLSKTTATTAHVALL